MIRATEPQSLRAAEVRAARLQNEREEKNYRASVGRRQKAEGGRQRKGCRGAPLHSGAREQGKRHGGMRNDSGKREA